MRAPTTLTLLMVFATALPAHSQAPIPAPLLANCEGCHGKAGQTRDALTPRLNGQTREYLVARLKDLRNPSNQTVSAIHAMLDPARSVPDTMIAALATHFSAQAPLAPNRSAAQRASGARLYAQGRGTAVPGCAGCHGDNGEGKGEAPRLAGQSAAYLEDQLSALMLTARIQPAMNKHAWAMDRADMQALAAFLAHD